MASHASSSSKAAPLETVEPTPMSEASSWVPPLALRLGPESQIPDHPGSVWDVPRPSNNYGRRPSSPSLSHQQYTYPPPPQDYMYSHDMYAHQQQQQQAGMTGMAIQPGSAVDASQLLTQCRFVLSEYQGLLARRRRASTASLNEIDARVRGQQAAVLHSLGELQIEVHDMVKEAKNHRWRKWLLGGVVASFIPLVRRIFRRQPDDKVSKESSNDTEYAFRRSSRIVAYLKDAVLGRGSWAKVAMFVFAVLYVFQNEVTLRVAKTLQRRLRRLTARIEEGAHSDLDEADLRVLQGWRWRVLLW